MRIDEYVRDMVVTALIVGGIVAVITTMVVQSQMTERTKFEQGYEQQPVTFPQTGYTGPVWVKK